MIRRTRLPAWSLCIALGLATSTAAAQPKELIQRAEAAYAQGVELANAGKGAEALKKFEESEGLLPSGRTSFQMGRIYKAMGKFHLAQAEFREAVRDDALPADMRHQAMNELDELKRKVALISLDVPDESEVWVGPIPIVGKRIKEVIEVSPGETEVKVVHKGKSRVVNVVCESGKVATVKIRFDDRGPSDLEGPIAPPPDLGTPTFWTTKHTVGVVLAGVAVVGAGLGVGFLLSRESNVSDQEDLARNPKVCENPTSGTCLDFERAGDNADRAGMISIISFAGAAAAGIGAAILLWPSGGSSSKGSLSPRVVPNGRGLSLVGTF